MSMFSGDLHALTLGILSLIFEGIWIPQLVLCSMKYDKARFFISLQMWMNAALLSPCVTSMPIVRILVALIVVSVNQDLLETEKHAPVRE